MRILVNGEPTTFEGHWTTVPEMVRSFYESGRFAGEMIADVFVNGEPVAMDAGEGVLPPGLDTLELTTVSSERAFDEAGRDVADRLSVLLDVLNLTVDAFRQGDDAGGHQAVVQLVPHLRDILSTAAETDHAKVAVLRLEVDRSVGLADPQTLLRNLGEMVAAQEQRDTVLMADLLEFELIPTIDGWHARLLREFGYDS
jgi:hypothetical protein